MMALLALGNYREGYSGVMSLGETEPAIPALMLFTLGAGVVISGVLLARFILKPRNEKIVEKTIGA